MDTPITITDRNKPAHQSTHLTIGALIFPRLDQIDMTGPFEVLSRIPNSTIHVIAKTKFPVRDIQGLILTPEKSIAEAPELDVLLVPSGFGQQQLMNDEEVLSLIRNRFTAGRLGDKAGAILSAPSDVAAPVNPPASLACVGTKGLSSLVHANCLRGSGRQQRPAPSCLRLA